MRMCCSKFPISLQAELRRIRGGDINDPWTMGTFTKAVKEYISIESAKPGLDNGENSENIPTIPMSTALYAGNNGSDDGG